VVLHPKPEGRGGPGPVGGPIPPVPGSPGGLRAGHDGAARLSLQYRDLLRAGYRVDLGGWRLYFLGGKLRLERHCQAVNPSCFTFGALPVDKAQQDRFLMELAALLDQALGEAARTRGTVTLSRLFRVELRRNQAPPYPAAPSGWKP